MGRAVTYIRQFGQVTSLHGLAHVVAPHRHPAERYLWVAVIVLGVVTSVYLIADNWQHYQANPTVLSLEKNYRAWKVSFPAATVCLLDRVNITRATAVIHRLWGEVPRKKFDYYMRFVHAVANLTYDNLQQFDEFKDDKDLFTINMAALASRVHVNLTYSSFVFNPAYNQTRFKETITEMGICYTYSGVLADYVSLRKNVKKRFENVMKPPYCNFLNSLCYARIEDLPGILRYYIHSPYETPDLSSNYYMVRPSRERDTSFQFLETVASRDLRALRPRQRRCRFSDEPWPDMVQPVYSYNLCRMACRQRLAFHHCGCAPYFYMPHKDIPVCSPAGLVCLSKHVQSITTLADSPLPCPCPLPCNNVEYFVDQDVERDWSYPVPCNIRFRWAIELYSKTRVRRDIIFGLEDLLVSFGGTAAFFLGCSVITFVELIYFFTLRLYWFLRPPPPPVRPTKVLPVRPTIKVTSW